MTMMRVVGGKVGVMTYETIVGPTGNLTWRVDTTPPTPKIGGCKSTFKKPVQGLERFELGGAPYK